jgi:hypothetical protein
VLTPLRDLLDRTDFDTGLFVGCVLGAFSFALSLVVVRRSVQLCGAFVCLGAVIAFGRVDVSVRSPGWLIACFVLLAVTGRVVSWLPRALPVRYVLLMPGALMLLPSLPFQEGASLVWLLFLFVVVAGAAAVDFGRWSAVQEVGPVLLAISLAGVYAVVPDTEHAAVALGVAAPMALTGWPVRAATLGPGGAAASVALIAYLAGTDGFRRPGAVVGAAACVGVLGFVPVLSRCGINLAQRRVGTIIPVGVPLLAVQAVVVALCSRWAGRQESAFASGVISAAVLAGGAVLLVLLYRAAARASPSSRPG